MKHTLDESEKRRAAGEACHLLNWTIGDLIVTCQLFENTHQWENVDPLPSKAIAATRRVILLSLVVIVYRLKEAREQLIAEWLLSETELENLGFPPIDQFIGRPKKMVLL